MTRCTAIRVSTSASRTLPLASSCAKTCPSGTSTLSILASTPASASAVRDLVKGDQLFLANYADVLTDAPLPEMVRLVEQEAKTAAFLCARPQYSFHVVQWKEGHTVDRIERCTEAEIWLNGGYFVLRPELFHDMQQGDELVEAPFKRLAEKSKLLGYRHRGFWAPMDTFKDHENLNEMHARGQRPWAVWERASALV